MHAPTGGAASAAERGEGDERDHGGAVGREQDERRQARRIREGEPQQQARLARAIDEPPCSGAPAALASELAATTTPATA